MAVLTFANTKGGAGKTTAVVIVACELARMGFSVAVLDADPQLWISKWHERLGDRAPASLSVVPYVTSANLGQHARKLRDEVDFLLIDLPGARSPLLAQALGYSNYVLIPVQGSAMDAEGATNVIELLQYLEDRADIRIPHSVVLTRVNPMVTTRALQSVKELLSSRRVHVLSTPKRRLPIASFLRHCRKPMPRHCLTDRVASCATPSPVSLSMRMSLPRSSHTWLPTSQVE